MTQLLRFDPSASFLPRTGIDEVELAGIEYSLGQWRDSVCASAASESDYLFLPEQLLEEYQRLRIDSELGRMLAVTKAMMIDVDRVLVIGGNADCLIAQALLDGCCQPYFNQLSRGERGSRPRIYIEGAGLDSDNLQGLLHLLGAHRDHRSTGVEDSWSIVAIRSESLHIGTQIAFEQFRRGLSASCGEEREAIDRRLIYITAGEHAASSPGGVGTEGANVANFFVSPRSHLQGTPFSAVGLIPAALMGINVMRLLEGAAAMNTHFRTARPSENMVLKYAGINRLLEQQGKAQVRVFNTWNPALESAGKWYEQLLGTQLGGMVPVTRVSPRDTLVSMSKNDRRVSQIVHHVIAENIRFDALSVINEANNTEAQDPEVPLGPLSDLLAANMESTAQHLRATGTPATNMYLPRVDEYYLGQYFQMMLLATQIESRL